MGGGIMSISRYFTDMLDPEMNWDDVAEMVRHWNGQFCLKGIMTIEDARRAVDIGCTGIVVRSEEHTSELQSLMRISYAVFCLKKKKNNLLQRNLKPHPISINTHIYQVLNNIH